MNDDVSTLAEWIASSASTVFFGGAGVSTESGIPDFRGANGFYFQEREIPLETVLSIDFFNRHPQAYWEWFHEVYRPVEPNGAHKALASLEAAGRLDAVITQNIDGLHQQAGSRAVWELHGNWERLVCTGCGAVAALGDATWLDGDPVPACPSCGSHLRPDIVMYGESLDEGVIEASVSAITRASTLIVAGTSLVVYPAAGLINYFSGDHLVLMNATPTSADAQADLIVREPVARTFDQVMDELRTRGTVSA
ncbi:NAD-dependent protein deacylase [Schaalia odontolytica]|uniref:NAD-dependent protein deacylase n=1 Tax=Schaalia odontolytica TaxID=1660 RepID=UPI0028D50A7F|nr:NAD-dependent protein deacylase [Schaalia odontolytica]